VRRRRTRCNDRTIEPKRRKEEDKEHEEIKEKEEQQPRDEERESERPTEGNFETEALPYNKRTPAASRKTLQNEKEARARARLLPPLPRGYIFMCICRTIYYLLCV
jgi:hypothetical protein